MGLRRRRLFAHHIYELKKGLRNLILFTTAETNRDEVERRLDSAGIAYLIQPVATDGTRADKINVFFGNRACLDVIETIGKPNLTDLTAEEDFILGTLLGYDQVQQCERYVRRRTRELDEPDPDAEPTGSPDMAVDASG
jgi:hypothetical protein